MPKRYPRYFSGMFEKLKKSKWYALLANKFVLLGLPFAVWMTFFDNNSWRMQRQLQKEIDKLEESIQYFEKELSTDRVLLQELETNNEAFEKYAREQFWMHREGEEIYVFEDER